MDANIKLGKLWGIPLGLHTSWFLIFALVTWSLAAGYLPGEYPDLSQLAYWLLGALTSLLFFASVLLHELGHSIIALRNEIPVRSITLFIFGGVAQIEREPRSPGAEFRIAMAGPLTSLGLAGLFYGFWYFNQGTPYLAAPSHWLARINLILGVFNLIPGFPLDGGRVLRALLWKALNSFQRATQAASFSGQVVAFAFIVFGMFSIFAGNLFNGVWLVFIGWFLQNAAANSYAQANLQKMLEGVSVSQVMLKECPRVSGQITLDQLVEDKVLSGAQRYFFVEEDGWLRGLLTLKDITALPRKDWPRILVEEAMLPLERLVQVSPEMKVLEALQRMDDASVAQVPVMEAGKMVGLLTRQQILRYVRVLGEIGS
jgi:Zn-dependent protease/CBS domain-containing protein